jgi:hypothetical protein
VLADLHRAIAAVCPIDGVESNGVIWFRPEATDEQRTAAHAIVASWDHTAPSQSDYQIAIQNLIDATAQSRQYTDGTSLAGYRDSTIAQWASEASAFIQWRDQVWSYAYQQLSAFEAGQRQRPSVDALLTELPPMKWTGDLA